MSSKFRHVTLVLILGVGCSSSLHEPSLTSTMPVSATPPTNPTDGGAQKDAGPDGGDVDAGTDGGFPLGADGGICPPALSWCSYASALLICNPHDGGENATCLSNDGGCGTVVDGCVNVCSSNEFASSCGSLATSETCRAGPQSFAGGGFFCCTCD